MSKMVVWVTSRFLKDLLDGARPSHPWSYLRPKLKFTLKLKSMTNSASETEIDQFTGAKVFFATKARDRDCLGEKITEWIRENPGHRIVSKCVTQSSDSAFHCITVTLFYQHES